MAGKIFISYRREDSAPHALSIGQYLEHEFGRRNVFIDVDMYAGAKFPVVLERRLAACKVMLVLIGPRWLNAIDEEGHLRLDNPEDWVRLEVASALKRGITVVPVRVGGAELLRKNHSCQVICVAFWIIKRPRFLQRVSGTKWRAWCGIYEQYPAKGTNAWH